jgi:hypothetical protein
MRDHYFWLMLQMKQFTCMECTFENKSKVRMGLNGIV